MAITAALSSSPRLRYATGATMYFAQGIPAGLLTVALPAWLTAQGVGPGDIGTYLAVIILPWAFKLVTGPFMDRYMFLPMGQRRPWILGAQLGLSLSLLALAMVENPAEQMGLLMAVGVLINCFAATQDVAVDGMSIDLTPVEEQGRLNAFMSFGKAAGWAVTAAVSGYLLVNFGMTVTAIAASAVAGLVFLAFVLVLERQGERRLPWSTGEARSQRPTSASFRKVFGGVNRVLWTRASVVVLLVMFFDGAVSGYGHALMPVAAVKVFGFSTEQWSQLVAVMGLVGAVIALAMGPLIDRFGSKRILVVNLIIAALHAILLAQTQTMWEDSAYVRVMLAAWVAMTPVIMVCAIALAMTLCKSTASATQFAIYMSMANLGASMGSKLFGMIAEQSNYIEIYMLMGAMTMITVLAVMFYRHSHESEPAGSRKARFTVASGPGGAGMFFSGAIRCPKCRADMAQVMQDGVQIDRCIHCHGIWFDAGEVDLLRHADAAKAIDTGTAREGRRYDAIEDYPCPRCGGEMQHHVDPEQVHIGFESCVDCRGSFFDAGEFRDLSQLTLSDFFKRVMHR